MKTNYRALLFHPEGDYVTDFTDRDEIQAVWEEVADMGSRWVFYPIAFVATEKRIADAPEGLEFLKGKSIKTAVNFFKETWAKNAQQICDDLNNGLPLSAIY